VGTCMGCGRSSREISKTIGVCAECLRADGERWREHIDAVHARARRRFGLPGSAPQSESDVACDLCLHGCRMAEGEVSFCGLRRNEVGTLVGGGADDGRVDWYHDPLPTNCVADWVCPGGTGAGYPDYAYLNGPEIGYANLAVFYRACSFDCLFCQNWHFRRGLGRAKPAAELANAVDDRTACICYFGGDPGPQLPHAIRTSELALEANSDRILRICWETNGGMSPSWLDRMIELSLASGGCIKFDLKAWDEAVHRALCGVSNRRTLANFQRVAESRRGRPVPPLLIASTPMVTGYVDAGEIAGIARFIAQIDPGIPYALLAFGPQFEMSDLPPTPRAQAEECMAAAREAGLTNVRIGNPWLLR